jgi:hypothetical protein
LQDWERQEGPSVLPILIEEAAAAIKMSDWEGQHSSSVWCQSTAPVSQGIVCCTAAAHTLTKDSQVQAALAWVNAHTDPRPPANASIHSMRLRLCLHHALFWFCFRP